MNIENFKPQPESFESIFVKQRELKFMYEPDAKDLFDQFDIDSFHDQEAFKRYCWRITEELTEAKEALHESLLHISDEYPNGDIRHFKEELIDGFNFLVEIYLLYGWSFSDMENYSTTAIPSGIEEQMWTVIYRLGITANCLKNRQWRKSQYLVDLLVFERRFKTIWPAYIELFKLLDMTDQEIFDLWSLKYQVNLFRIKSKY